MEKRTWFSLGFIGVLFVLFFITGVVTAVVVDDGWFWQFDLDTGVLSPRNGSLVSIVNLSVNGSLLFNGSLVCTADNGVCPVGGGNGSWNQTAADALYYPRISSPGKPSNPLGYFNSSDGRLDNQSWNETKASMLYYPKDTNPWGFYNSSTLPPGSGGVQNISGVTNQTQTLEFSLYPITAGYSGFPSWEHNETTGQHILKIGLLPNEVDTAGLLSSNDYNTFNNKVSSQWTSFGTTYPRGIYYQDSGINQVFMGDSFDISNTTQLNNFWTAISGPAVIYYDAGASKKPHTNAGYLGFGYPLSIQKAGVDAYLEIANWNGENQGVFFGNYDKNFELWSYAGGPIIFYTSPFASDGYERVRITPNGTLVTGGLGGSYDTWNAWGLIGANAYFTNVIKGLEANFTKVVAPTINATTRICIADDCRTAWPTADNSSWNQTFANSIYYPYITNPLSYYNSSYGNLDNASWNQTYANSIYYPYITNPLSYYNSSSPPTLDVIGNPTASKTFTMANKNLSFVFTAPTDNAFEIEALGGFSGDLLHVHQHTGNPPTGTDLIHIESSDADVLPLNITTPAGRSVAIATTANITVNGKQVLTTDNELDYINSTRITIVECDAANTFSCVINSTLAQRMTITVTGFANSTIGTSDLRLTRNGTVLYTLIVRQQLATNNVPFTLQDYNGSMSTGSWNFSIVKGNTSLNIGNIKAIARLEP